MKKRLEAIDNVTNYLEEHARRKYQKRMDWAVLGILAGCVLTLLWWLVD